MALIWDWDIKIGTAVVAQGKQEFELNLYQGNAFLIMIHEYQDQDGVDKYSMYTFFADKEHAKNCLGIGKRTDGIFDDYYRLLKVRINKKMYSYTKELVDMLIKAFDEIKIEIYSEQM